MAARAIWKGVITLGKLKVPVKLYSAVQDRGVHFNLLHDQDMTPVAQRMIDITTGEPVEREAVQKGVEVEPGQFVIVHEDELAALEPEASRDIVVERFIADEQLSHAWYERPYYLGPDGDDEAYFALAAALEGSGKEGLARWVMRKREYLGALRVERGYLMLITLRHTDEVISVDDLEPPTGRKIDARELEMAEQLVGALEDTFRPEEYRDEHRDRVMQLIEKKARGQKITIKKPVEKKVTPQSLESVLRASLDAARASGHGADLAAEQQDAPADEGRHGRKAARRPARGGGRRGRGGARKERSRG